MVAFRAHCGRYFINNNGLMMNSGHGVINEAGVSLTLTKLVF